MKYNTTHRVWEQQKHIIQWKKRSERRKHCAGCSKAGPKISAPLQTPFPGARDGQNLISWRRSLPAPTDVVWWRSMHAILSYRGNRHRLTATNTQTGQDRLQYTAPLARAQCNQISCRPAAATICPRPSLLTLWAPKRLGPPSTPQRIIRTPLSRLKGQR